jgi:hypothetical protein
MNTNNAVLDQITKAIDNVLKEEQIKPRRTTQVMTPEALIAYVVGQIKEAASEPSDKAMQRLKVLRTKVEQAKAAFEDGTTFEFDVYPFDTTADEELSQREVEPLDVAQPPAKSGFAYNPEDLHATLQKLGKQIEALKDGTEGTTTSAPAAAQIDPWPVDMNAEASREGVQKNDDGLSWGSDPVFDRAAPKKA